MHHEIPRQAVHLSGLAFVFVAQYLGKPWAFLVFFAIAAFFFVYAEHVKRAKPIFGFRRLVFFFEKRGSSRPFVGAFWFYMGSGIAFVLFPLNIALAASAILSVGDSFSTIFGVHFGKHKIIGKKSLEGSLAFLIGSFLISLIFVKPLIAFLGALVGALVELYTPDKIRNKKVHWVFDDNLLIPIISGAVMFILLFF